MLIEVYDQELALLAGDRRDYFNSCGNRQNVKTVFDTGTDCYRQFRKELEAAKRAAWLAKNPPPTPPAGRPKYPKSAEQMTGYDHQSSTPTPTTTTPMPPPPNSVKKKGCGCGGKKTACGCGAKAITKRDGTPMCARCVLDRAKEQRGVLTAGKS